jgi:hypothetical protein
MAVVWPIAQVAQRRQTLQILWRRISTTPSYDSAVIYN